MSVRTVLRNSWTVRTAFKMKFLVLSVLVACVCADVSHIVGQKDESRATILKQELDVGKLGEYQWSYETDNGIAAREQGALKDVPGAEVPAQVAQGEARWTAPDGQVVQFQYTADENGYVAQGPFIPTPPPIPAEIIRSIEYIRAHPPKEN